MTEVITALGPRWEASVATALERVPGVTIARRCADVAELLSVAEAGVGEVAVVSFDLRALELDVVARLRSKGMRVIGLHPADDEAAQRRLRQLAVSDPSAAGRDDHRPGRGRRHHDCSARPGREHRGHRRHRRHRRHLSDLDRDLEAQRQGGPTDSRSPPPQRR